MNEKKEKLSREQMEQAAAGEIRNDEVSAMAGPGEKIIFCSNCSKPIYASITEHIVKCPHCGAITIYR